ncbi:MAG: SpoIIE family protein phosphatase [Verrucomicrobiota bacterium]|nr:SpoIIE family protein phosphatase [Verrucomicrobiota bacterium]
MARCRALPARIGYAQKRLRPELKILSAIGVERDAFRKDQHAYSNASGYFRILGEMQKEGEILVVDDDRLTRQLLLRTLSSAGYACSESESGEEAWERVHAKQPLLLLLDFDMPGLNGAEFLKQLRSDQDSAIAQIPAIMLTGHGGEESEVRCLEAGANDFVTKPINPAVLRARIETQLRLRSMRRQLEQQNEELEAWRRNLERDLAAARLTQQSLIPQKPLKIPGWDIAACFRPVIQVGGDIYGWLAMKDGRILFWIADATGHGASAALLTTLTKLLFHHGSLEHTTPAAVMEAVNDDFRSIFGVRLLMTAMCVALEPATGRAMVVGAGHPPLLILRDSGKKQFVWSSAPPLGLAERAQFVETIVDLHPDDAFILYTDGLFGSSKAKRARLNPQKLAEMLDHSASSADVLLMRLLKQAAPVDGDGTLSDDIAALAVRRNS